MIRVTSEYDIRRMAYYAQLTYELGKSQHAYDLWVTNELMQSKEGFNHVVEVIVKGINTIQEAVWEAEWEQRQKINKTYAHYKDKLKPGQRIV